MGKFDGILMCTDLDGTLFKKDKTISEENVRAIEYFKSEGGYFTFITGRMPMYVPYVYNTINPNAPFGCINGGGIYDHRKEKYVYTVELDRRALTLVDAVDRELPMIGIQVNSFEKVYFNKDNEAMIHFRKETGAPNYRCHYRAIEEPLAKVVFGENDEDNILALAKLLSEHELADEFDFIRSDKNLYEILPKGISKGNVLMKMCDILSIDPKRSVAVGDYDNDVSMIKAAGLGIAVSNATETVKAVADAITVSNEEHAIAKIIYDLDKGILKI